MAKNDKPNNKAVISAEVDSFIKEDFKKWWQQEGYATEAEAVRSFVREKIKQLQAKDND